MDNFDERKWFDEWKWFDDEEEYDEEEYDEYYSEEYLYELIKQELPGNTPEKWIELVAFGGPIVIPEGSDWAPISAWGHCVRYDVISAICENCAYSWLMLWSGETGKVCFEDGSETCPVCDGQSDGLEYRVAKRKLFPAYFKE